MSSNGVSAIRSSLEANHHVLVSTYREHLVQVRRLQSLLIDDILPGVLDELGLDEDNDEVREKVEKVKEWLNDSQSLFRTCKRHKFTTSFALESLRETLIWRLTSFPTTLSSPSPLVCALPHDIRDPFGRPILVVRLNDVTFDDDGAKEMLLNVMERSRVFLRDLNIHPRNGGDGATDPILQFVLLIDINGISLQTFNMNLINWYLHTAHPLFPGMLAAAFVLNYSWTHAGVWGFAKHALPSSVLSRIFLPSNAELAEYFGAEVLPQDFGGSLPPLDLLYDPLNHTSAFDPFPRHLHPSLPTPPATPTPSSSCSPAHNGALKAASITPARRFPSDSFYGYPHPTRRRKRDLLKTLLKLFWKKHGSKMIALSILATVVAILTRRGKTSILKRR